MNLLDIVSSITSILALIVAIVALFISLRNSKGSIWKRIDRKDEQIRLIDHQQNMMYGLNGRSSRVITPLDEKRAKLVSEIEELKRQL